MSEKNDDRYEMISGHRRKAASELANLDTLPCVVRNLSDDEAVIIMVDSNLQREKVLFSEKAFAYKMKQDFDEVIFTLMLDIFIENPDLFLQDISGLSFLEKRISFSEKNTMLLEKLSEKLANTKCSKDYSVNELWQMEKFYLLYPDQFPEEFRDLSWNQLKILINIFSKEKRKFYTDICLKYHCDDNTLKNYILNDVFEKYIFLRDEKKENCQDLLDKVIKYDTLIFE